MKKTSNNQTISYFTLGCKLNFAETSAIIKGFTKNGFEKVEFNQAADISIINTCTVTAQAEKKSRQAIKKAIKTSNNGKIIVIGCAAQINPDKLAEINGVDLIIGAKNKFKTYELVQKHFFNQHPAPTIQHSKTKKLEPKNLILYSCNINQALNYDSAFSEDERTRAFLKVQDGCDYKCTYCTIPLARGKSRNTNINEIVEQAKIIANKGFLEIVLTGVNIGDFGKSTDENFLQLIIRLNEIEKIKRYRISSIEPNLLTTEIINFVAKSDKFLPHFHIPLQNGSDKILKLMQRRYNSTLFENKIKTINKLIPAAFIGIDVIVGFPGETDLDFQQTYDLLARLQISFLHIFPYSDRKNTKSIKMSQKIDGNIIKQRSNLLQKLSDKKHEEFYKQNIGKKSNVLFEAKRKNGKIAGFTENYLLLEKEYDEKLINKIVEMEIK